MITRKPSQPMTLTDRQQQYIWLMGSYPSFTVEQGRGYRTKKMMYGFDHENKVLYIFGYSNPLYFLTNRGLTRQLQDMRRYTLTDTGEAEFRKLVLCQAGLRLNKAIIEVELKGSKDDTP